MKNQTYKTVDELLRDVFGNDFADDVQTQVELCKQVSALMILRCKANLSQSEFAEKANWLSIAVEEIEEGTDSELTKEIIETYIRICKD